jgi:hypothetical protein
LKTAASLYRGRTWLAREVEKSKEQKEDSDAQSWMIQEKRKRKGGREALWA